MAQSTSSPDPVELHRQLADAIEADDLAALAVSRALWAQAPGQESAGRILRARDILNRHGVLRWAPHVRIERSATFEPLLPLLRAAALVDGLDLRVTVGPFNAYSQSVLNPSSELYDLEPEIVIVAIELADISPRLAGLAPMDTTPYGEAAREVGQRVVAIMDAYRSRSSGTLLVHDFAPPQFLDLGVADARSGGQAAAIRALNDHLHEAARERSGVHMVGYSSLIGRHGLSRWRDAGRWEAVHLPLTAEAMPQLAKEWLRFIYPVAGRTAKVIVSDLDNTLWGGVLGEEGRDGLALEGIAGVRYRNTQRALLQLQRRGVAVALASKNDEAEVLDLLATHEAMALREEDLSAWRINWSDKATQIKEIANELNIGTDAIAFMDDNPAERIQVTLALPEAIVIEPTGSQETFAEALLSHPALERLAISAEDTGRTALFHAQRKRQQLASHANTLEDFYRSLEQHVSFEEANEHNLDRLAQLTQKTNQFNVTTRRYSRQELETLSRDLASRIVAARVTDRFGDNGLVGLAIVNHQGAVAEIDTLLLSCRVIGRTVETAMLSRIVEQASEAGLASVRGAVIPTAKNGPARDVFMRHGFAQVGEEDGTTLWSLSLPARIAIPEWNTIDEAP